MHTPGKGNFLTLQGIRPGCRHRDPMGQLSQFSCGRPWTVQPWVMVGMDHVSYQQETVGVQTIPRSTHDILRSLPNMFLFVICCTMVTHTQRYIYTHTHIHIYVIHMGACACVRVCVCVCVCLPNDYINKFLPCLPRFPMPKIPLWFPLIPSDPRFPELRHFFFEFFLPEALERERQRRQRHAKQQRKTARRRGKMPRGGRWGSVRQGGWSWHGPTPEDFGTKVIQK